MTHTKQYFVIGSITAILNVIASGIAGDIHAQKFKQNANHPYDNAGNKITGLYGRPDRPMFFIEKANGEHLSSSNYTCQSSDNNSLSCMFKLMQSHQETPESPIEWPSPVELEITPKMIEATCKSAEQIMNYNQPWWGMMYNASPMKENATKWHINMC